MTSENVKIVTRIIGGLLVVVALAKVLATIAALLTAPGHAKQVLSEMAGLPISDVILVVLGVCCLAYAAYSDGVVVWVEA